MQFDPVIKVENDGFVSGSESSWLIEKNRLIYGYFESFFQNLRGNYDDIVFVDLCSGSGVNKIGDSAEHILGSPLFTLASPLEFSKYIFCEKDEEKANALKVRVNKSFRSQNILVLQGDTNNMIDKLQVYIPQTTRKNRVAMLCLLDSGSMDIHFETVEFLADMKASFVNVQSFELNSFYNYQLYQNESRELLNNYLGKAWSSFHHEETIESNELFYRYLVRSYKERMDELGYRSAGGFHRIKDNPEFVIPVYYMGFYSTTQPVTIIEKSVREQAHKQTDLFQGN